MTDNTYRLCVIRCRICESVTLAGVPLTEAKQAQMKLKGFVCPVCRGINNPVLLYSVKNEQ